MRVLVVALLALSPGCIAIGSDTACLTGVETYVDAGGQKWGEVPNGGAPPGFDTEGWDVRGGVSLFWDLTGACNPGPDEDENG